MVERGSGIAVWRQIGESLADDIRNKLYLAGEQLPSEPELAAKFAVNRHTIRRAMGELEQSGLVRIEQAAAPSCRNMPSTTPSASARAFPRTCAARACWGTWKRWQPDAARRRHRQAPGPAAQRAAAARASGGQGRKPAHQRVRTLLRRKALSRFRRTPDRAEIGVQGLCALRHRRLHAQMVAHHGGAALARSGAAAGQPKTRPILQVEALNVDQQGAPCSTASPGSWGPGAADGQRRQLSTAWRRAGPGSRPPWRDRTNRANPLIHLDIWL